MNRFIVNMKRFIKMNRYKKYVQLRFSAANQSSSAASDPVPLVVGQAVFLGRREGAKVLKEFAVMLQGVMNGISPLNKGKTAHHPDVVSFVSDNMGVWQGAVEKFSETIAERGHQLNLQAQL